ncbi:MAG: hypothetical protein H0U27_00605 [Nitrosopumilus sp.]|nr:hypothetical protein [Nitrosopumilus sp.]
MTCPENFHYNVSGFMKLFNTSFHRSNHYESVNKNKIPSFFKDCFSINAPLSSKVVELYHQEPEINILEEKIIDHYYTRKQITEILTDHFSFSPIIYSYLIIDLLYPYLINPKELFPFEEALYKQGSNAKMITSQFIKVEDWEELNQYLSSESYGKLASLIIHGKPVADLLEFISIEPNINSETKVFDSINNQLLSSTELNRNIEIALQHIKGALEITPQAVLDTYFPSFNSQVKHRIEEMVEGVDHIAILVPFETNMDQLESIASRVGFTDNHQIDPSVIVAKELGTLVGKDIVSTLVFKACGFNSKHQKIGLEVFVPREKFPEEHDWIAQGITTHLSLRVKSLDDISKIREILVDQHIEMAKFLKGKLILENQVYFDVMVNDIKMRIEFNY